MTEEEKTPAHHQGQVCKQVRQTDIDRLTDNDAQADWTGTEGVAIGRQDKGRKEGETKKD